MPMWFWYSSFFCANFRMYWRASLSVKAGPRPRPVLLLILAGTYRKQVKVSFFVVTVQQTDCFTDELIERIQFKSLKHRLNVYFLSWTDMSGLKDVLRIQDWSNTLTRVMNGNYTKMQAFVLVEYRKRGKRLTEWKFRFHPPIYLSLSWPSWAKQEGTSFHVFKPQFHSLCALNIWK